MSYYVSLRSEFLVVMFTMIYATTTKPNMFGSPLPSVVGTRAHVLFTLFVFVCVLWGPSNTYCVVFSSSCVPYVFSNVSFVFHYYRLFCFVEVHVLLMLLVCIYAYWCPTRFPYHTPFVSPNSITTSVTREVGTRVQSFVVFILLNV